MFSLIAHISVLTSQPIYDILTRDFKWWKGKNSKFDFNFSIDLWIRKKWYVYLGTIICHVQITCWHWTLIIDPSCHKWTVYPPTQSVKMTQSAIGQTVVKMFINRKIIFKRIYFLDFICLEFQSSGKEHYTHYTRLLQGFLNLQIQQIQRKLFVKKSDICWKFRRTILGR